jgi:hypothetical protein
MHQQAAALIADLICNAIGSALGLKPPPPKAKPKKKAAKPR